LHGSPTMAILWPAFFFVTSETKVFLPTTKFSYVLFKSRLKFLKRKNQQEQNAHSSSLPLCTVGYSVPVQL